MGKRDAFTKFLAVAGTVLVAIPLLLPLLFGLIRVVYGDPFLFDYLMPAELFLAVLVGGLLLLWAALRARLRRKWIGWSLGLAFFFLAAAMLLAQVSGLATGAIQPQGLWWIATLTLLGLYILMVLLLAVGGGMLSGDVFRGGKG